MNLRNVPYKYLVATAFIFGIFMDILDSTIVNVALPTLGRQFHAGEDTLEWVVTGYLLSLAVWVPASGWIGDRFGTKKTFLFALTMFTAGSALCGLSQSIGQLIAFRILQGVGGGMLTPVGTAMLFRAFPPRERARASAVMAIPIVIAPAAGPVLGGWLVDAASWRWIFYVNLPIGLAGFIFSLLYIREHREPATGSFDLWGFLFSGGGLALILYALSQGPNAGWTAPRVLAAGLAGVTLFTLLVVVELRLRAPMLNLRLFSDRMFRNSNAANFMATGSLIGVLFLLPLFLQDLMGLSALQSGLTTFPQAIGVIAITPLAGRIYPSVGPRRLLAAGLIGATLTSVLFLFIDLQTAQWWIRALMFARGLSLGLSLIPLQTATFATIKAADTGQASALFNTLRQVSSSIGVAILATTLVSRSKTHVAAALRSAAPAARPQAVLHARLLGFHDAFLAAVLLAAIGVAFAFLIHDEDAAETMQRGPVSEREPVAVH